MNRIYRIIFEGGPNTGKSSTAKAFEPLGAIVIPEIARQVIQDDSAPKQDDVLAFHMEILRRILLAESESYPANSVVIQDRGAHGVEAYCIKYGIEVPQQCRSFSPRQYDLVFLFDPIPDWEHDGLRIEDLAFTEVINPIIETVYAGYGFSVIRVPLMPVEERVAFILSEMATAGIHLPLAAEVCGA